MSEHNLSYKRGRRGGFKQCRPQRPGPRRFRSLLSHVDPNLRALRPLGSRSQAAAAAKASVASAG